MYLRFRTQFINKEDKPQFGIFNAMEFICEHSHTSDEEEVQLKELYRWFKDNLEVPKHFYSDSATYGWEEKSLSWFKDSAKEHIAKLREAVVILEKYDLIVETIWETDPGNIKFEDDVQISAIPYKLKPKLVR